MLKNLKCDLRPSQCRFHFLSISNAATAAQLIRAYFCVRFMLFLFSLHSASHFLHFLFFTHHFFSISSCFYCFLNGVMKYMFVGVHVYAQIHIRARPNLLLENFLHTHSLHFIHSVKFIVNSLRLCLSFLTQSGALFVTLKV